MAKFKNEHTVEQRKAESERIRAKYPDRIPVICEKTEKSNVQDIDKKKYLVPADLTCGQFVYVIRKRLKLPAEQAIFLFVNGIGFHRFSYRTTHSPQSVFLILGIGKQHFINFKFI